jgi:high affinity Mn2+ porin
MASNSSTFVPRLARPVLLVAFLVFSFGAASGQQAPAPSPDSQQDATTTEGADEPDTMVPHSNRSRFWISGQANMILQWHSRFPAKYSGPESFGPQGENATSRVLSLYTGVQLTGTTSFLFDIESAGGRGLSQAFGLAGFTNLDVVRNPSLGSTPYIARAMLHQIIPLSNETVEVQRGFLSLFTSLPSKRLEIRAGKFGMADFFDVNSVGGDSHLQFMNWTIDNNGAYDYAADTRGYTFGVIVEYQEHRWGLRFAEALMPRVANGIKFDWNLRRARSENLEIELRPVLIRGRSSVIRLLAYSNQANMGTFREAIEAFERGETAVPDIAAHPLRTATKYGFGAGVEQELTERLRVFGRVGWNEGRHESYAYTQVNNSFQFGGDLRGDRWKRKHDKVGAAMASNGLSRDHREYLALGGIGFLLGDGRLTYGRETIFEGYYTAHLWRGLSGSFDLQHINNPGYNQDRGPVLVPSIRLHAEF